MPDISAKETPPEFTTQFAPFIACPSAAMSSSNISPRRSTITSFRPLPLPPPPSPQVLNKPGICTHMKVTRLYTTKFACQVCGEFGPMGWVFRCVQDREIMLEHDLQVGCCDKLDDLCDDLETSNVPKKRSAAARESPLSLLDEMTEEQLATYTPSQISTLLKQRCNLQKVLAETNVLPPQNHEQYAHQQAQPFAMSTNTPFQFPPTPSPLKPWVPLKECQWKVCASCRPSFRDKSYLSLDAILNGDVPATASMGFGFHLAGQRPVSDVRVVRNLGLRDNPEIRDDVSCDSLLTRRSGSSSDSDSSASPNRLHTNIKRRLAHVNLASLGLGITSLNPDSKDGETMDRPKTPNNLIYSADGIGSSSAITSTPVNEEKSKYASKDRYRRNRYSTTTNTIITNEHGNRTANGVAVHDFAYPAQPPTTIPSTTKQLFKHRPSKLPLPTSSPGPKID